MWARSNLRDVVMKCQSCNRWVDMVVSAMIAAVVVWCLFVFLILEEGPRKVNWWWIGCCVVGKRKVQHVKRSIRRKHSQDAVEAICPSFHVIDSISWRKKAFWCEPKAGCRVSRASAMNSGGVLTSMWQVLKKFPSMHKEQMMTMSSNLSWICPVLSLLKNKDTG